MYLLDGPRWAAAITRPPLHVTAKYTAPGVAAGVSSWEDQGTRWILAPQAGAVGGTPPGPP